MHTDSTRMNGIVYYLFFIFLLTNLDSSSLARRARVSKKMSIFVNFHKNNIFKKKRSFAPFQQMLALSDILSNFSGHCT